jgi:uroporphyrinogen decarboxylase
MGMTHKERVLRALLHQPVDRFPTQINYTQAMGKKLADFYAISIGELPRHLDNHLIRVDISFPQHKSLDGQSHIDWWGAGHDMKEEGYFINFNPLGSTKNLDEYPWPDPYEPGLLDDARQTIQEYGQEYFIVPNFGWVLFERAWSLRGLEQTLMDMVLDAGFISDLLDRILEIQLVLIERYLDLGVDGGYFGDDYGAQKGLLFSPRLWRALIKPRLERLFAPFRKRDLPVIMHSDGQIQPILPDLIEIGLTTLNPVQPEVINHQWLHANYRDRLSFYGGISTQTVLPRGEPDQVRKAVNIAVHMLAPSNTGLIIAPSHRLMSDVPFSNLEALIAAFEEINHCIDKNY